MKKDFLQIGWAVVDKDTYTPPYVGNGNQYQLPIFKTRAEAYVYLNNEKHGLFNHIIKRVGIKLIS